MQANEALGQIIAELEALQAGALSPDFYYRWIQPSPLVDGTFINGYCAYTEAMERLWTLFAAAGCDFRPADYVAWLDRQESPYDPASIAEMGRPDLAMLLLAIRRGERFCDGQWPAMLGQGVFLAIARRMLALMA